MWGSTIAITADPSQTINKYQHPFYKGDSLYAYKGTTHQGVWHQAVVQMTWDGSKFVGRMAVPEGSEWGNIGLYTAEKYLNIRTIFLPRSANGTLPPGAMSQGGHDRKNWKADIEAELAKDPQMTWAYKHIWGMRYIAMRNISPAELLREVELIEKENKQTPALLKSLAYGYFLAGQPQKGFETLARLCRQYPDSAYSVAALRDADYQVFSHNWENLKGEVARLGAEVFNRSPENAAIWGDLDPAAYLLKTPGIALESVRKTCRLWMKDDPKSMRPYLALADALAQSGMDRAEAEELVSKALELSYLPHPPELMDEWYRGQAYRLRAKLREQKNDFTGALSDARMAQIFALKHETEDLDIEAELWLRLGYLDRAESAALEAYRRGSLATEKSMKDLYALRTGSEEGFRTHFMARLTGENETEKDLLPAPAFKAATLDGANVSLENLKGKITVLNFWFINCGPCRGEMPELNKIVDEFKEHVRFLAFATDSAEDLRDFLKKEHLQIRNHS